MSWVCPECSIRSHNDADEWCGHCGSPRFVHRTDSLNVHGYTVTSEQGLTQDERDGLTAYLSMLRKAQDRKRGIVDLDAT